MYFKRFNTVTFISLAILATMFLPNVHSFRFMTSTNSSGIQFITHAEFKDLAMMFPNLYAIMSSLPVRLADPNDPNDPNEQRSNSDSLNTVSTTEPTNLLTEPTTVRIEPVTVQTQPTTIPVEPITAHTHSTPIRMEITTIPTQPTTVPTEPTTVPVETTTVPTQPTTVPVEATTVQRIESTIEGRAALIRLTTVPTLPSTVPSIARLIKGNNTTVPAVQKPSIAWFINSTHSDTLNSSSHPESLNALLNKTNFINPNNSLGYNPIVRIENVPKSSDFWFLFNPVNATFDKLQSDRKDKYDMFAYSPTWIIGLSVIGTVIAVFFLGCIVAICYTRRPYRRPGKVYEIESANRKNNIPQIPTINPATRTATLVKNKESFY